MLFHKYEGANVRVTNCMQQFSMFVPTQTNTKLDNGNRGYVKGIGIILCYFPNWPIIYPVGPVYWCPGHLYSTISLVALKNYLGFKNFTPEPLKYCDLVDPQGHYWNPPYSTCNNLDCLQIEFVKLNSTRNKYNMVPTSNGLSKNNIFQRIHKQLVKYLLTHSNKCLIKGSWRVYQQIHLTWNNPSLSISWLKKLKSLEVLPLMSQSFSLGSCFKWILSSSILKVSVALLQLLWLHVLPLHTPLALHQETNAQHLTSKTHMRMLISSGWTNMVYWKYILDLCDHFITWIL